MQFFSSSNFLTKKKIKKSIPSRCREKNGARQLFFLAWKKKSTTLFKKCREIFFSRRRPRHTTRDGENFFANSDFVVNWTRIRKVCFLTRTYYVYLLLTSLAYLNRFLQKLDPPRQNFTINRRILLRSNKNIAIERSRKYTIIFGGFPIWFWSKLIFSWLELCIQNLITYVRSWPDNNNIDFKSQNISVLDKTRNKALISILILLIVIKYEFKKCNKVRIMVTV